MIEDLKQTELDIFEEAVLRDLWHDIAPPPKIRLALNLAGYDVQNVIDKFEALVKPVMTSQGLVNGKQLKNILRSTYPGIVKLVNFPEEDFRLIDKYRWIQPFVKMIGDKINV